MDDNQQFSQPSQQTRELKRRLTWRLVIDWLVYTVIFALIAFLLNITVIPRIADAIADNTSQWSYWYLDDYPLDVCLKALDGGAYYIADGSREDLDRIADKINALYGLNSDYSVAPHTATDVRVAGGDADFGARISAGNSSAEDALIKAETEGLSREDMADSNSESGIDEVDAFDAEFWEKIVNLDTGAGVAAYVGDNYDAHDVAVYAQLGNEPPQWYSLAYLQQTTILKQNPELAKTSDHWQYIYLRDSIAARDLTTYNLIRPLKYPLIVVLYLMGCIVIFFVGYGRALKYFNELFAAVGKMMVDREKPIKLSKKLATTQNELNAIRLSSLADERAAQAAERRKDELVAYLAHDIRTPLTSVIGYLSLLDEAGDMDADTRKRYIHIAFDKSQRLETLIDEFFEITRYNLQAIPIERENVDVLLLCEQVAEEFYPDAEAKGVKIKIDAPEKSMIFVDPNKIARVIGNVLRNAVAYADTNTDIVIQAHLQDNESMRSDGESANHVKESLAASEDVDCSTSLKRAKHATQEHENGDTWVITITNSGREISEVHLQKIFEKFFREDASRGSSSGRSGLGLAIAKEIIVAHDGNIEASSKDGITIFTITLPAK